ncbi:MAG: hypothetical protein GSR86_06595 [Desulfurococcales archaeon]|nr:hypothetical protein [Desulfurococcales archaeon]
MNPKKLLFFTILLSAVTGIVVYAVYPLEPDESISIVEDNREQLPGFAVSIASVGNLKEYVTVEGVIVSHGLINVSGKHLPFILIDSNGTVYKVVLGRKTVNEIADELVGKGVMEEFRVSMMTGHKVTVRGYLVKDNIVVARDLIMHDMWSEMPMHRGGWHGRHR